MSLSLRTKKLLISLIAAAVLGLLVLVALNTVQALRGIQDLWQGHVRDATQHLADINGVRQQFGYGGLSHHFHHFLLSPGNPERREVEQALIRLNEAIARTEPLNLSPLERMALASIADVAGEYRHVYMLVRGLNSRADVLAQGGERLRVDDSAAINALRLLDELAVRRVELAEGEARERLDGAIRGIYIGALLIPLIVMLTLLLLHFLNRISQANRALEQLGNELDALLDNAPEAMLMMGAGGQVLRVNARSEALFGYRRDELLMMNLATLLPDCQLDVDTDPANIQALQGSTQKVRIRGGQRLAVELAVGRLQEGGHTSLILTLRDMEARLRAQQRIEQLNSSLLRQNRELETVNHELEAFSYSVSHDLRAPLRGIDGFSQLLSRRYANLLDSVGQDYLQRIIKATARMGHIIDDLLQLSRTSRAKMNPAYLDLSTIAREVLMIMADTEPERQVEWHVQPGLHGIGDPGLLRVVLDNLLGNAWKYSATRSQAEIRFAAETRDGELVFSVCDNGVGFDMQYVNKLFAPFQRLHGAEEFDGSGIGLSTVQRIIQRHGGRIWAESEPEHGACFYFTLGMREDEELAGLANSGKICILD